MNAPRTALVVVGVAVMTAAPAWGGQMQGVASPSPLDKPARLVVDDQPLAVALNELQAASGVRLAYSPDLVPGSRVACSCETVTVGEALERLLGDADLRVVARSGQILIVPAAEQVGQTGPGVIAGSVRDGATQTPIVNARVQLRERYGTDVTGTDGRFVLRDVPEGAYTVAVVAIGYRRARIAPVRVAPGDTTLIAIELERAPISLAEIVISPGTFDILDDQGIVTQQTLTREDVQTRPHVGEDIYRTVDRLPGVATGDVTAKFHVRGAPNDQVLVTLDGLELYEPFHLKDFDGALSIIDVEAVADVDLITGGFPVEYGDKMTGVFAMETANPPTDRTSTALGLSISNLTFMSQGSFAAGRGGWLASARRGYLDLVFKITGEESDLSPTYYDLLGKVQYQLAQHHMVSAHFLHAGDDLTAKDEAIEVESGWSSTYGWVNWLADLTSDLSLRTTLSAGGLTRRRAGVDFFGFDDTQRLSVDDHATFDFAGLKQDWSLLISNAWLLQWGWDLKRGAATYDYHRWSRYLEPNTTNPFAPPFDSRTETVDVDTDPSGEEAGLYLSSRLRPSETFTAEVGLRYDHQTHTGDGTIAPRVNTAVEMAPNTTVRGAWGYYYQAHGLHELNVPDGDDRFYPAQRAEQRVLGVEQQLGDGTSLRVEAYERRITDPRPEYRRIINELEAFPEDQTDRIRVEPTRGRARGIELFVKHDAGERFAWSGSYALAWAEDDIDGRWTPRPLDQRHTVQLDIAYRPNTRWAFSAAWQFHSGWPGTVEGYAIDTLAIGAPVAVRSFGPLNGDRLPAYHRLDLRMSRYYRLGRGRLSLFFDVFNFYDRQNPTAFDYYVFFTEDGSRATIGRNIYDMIGVLPTVGARWEF